MQIVCLELIIIQYKCYFCKPIDCDPLNNCFEVFQFFSKTQVAFKHFNN